MDFNEASRPLEPEVARDPLARAIRRRRSPLPGAGEWRGVAGVLSTRIGCSIPLSGRHTTSRVAVGRPVAALPLCTRVSGSSRSQRPTVAARRKHAS
jgi:hypothetical protein